MKHMERLATAVQEKTSRLHTYNIYPPLKELCQTFDDFYHLARKRVGIRSSELDAYQDIEIAYEATLHTLKDKITSLLEMPHLQANHFDQSTLTMMQQAVDVLDRMAHYRLPMPHAVDDIIQKAQLRYGVDSVKPGVSSDRQQWQYWTQDSPPQRASRGKTSAAR